MVLQFLFAHVEYAVKTQIVYQKIHQNIRTGLKEIITLTTIPNKSPVRSI
jgi:hypothetical protein